MALRGLLSHCNLAESLLLSDPSNLESYKELPSKEAIICASNQSKLTLFHIFSYPFKVNSIKGFVPNGYISPWSALAHSDDRNAIIFFPASKGLFLSNSTKLSGDTAFIFFKNRSALFRMPFAGLQCQTSSSCFWRCSP